jgi:hypothetical protein
MHISAQQLYNANRDRLSQLAYRAIRRGMMPIDFVIVCIDVDSGGAWAMLVETLMPGHAWQPYRERGELPIARGSVRREGIADLLDIVAPDAAPAVRSVPRPGLCHAVVFTKGCATVYEIAPEPDPS